MPNSIEPLEPLPSSVANAQSAVETKSTTFLADLARLLDTDRLRLPLVSALLSLLSALILYLYSLARHSEFVRPTPRDSDGMPSSAASDALSASPSAPPVTWLLMGAGLSMASAMTLFYYLERRYLGLRRLAPPSTAVRMDQMPPQSSEPRSDLLARAPAPTSRSRQAILPLGGERRASSAPQVRAAAAPPSPQQKGAGRLAQQITRLYHAQHRQVWIKLLLVGLAILVALTGLWALAQNHLPQGVALVIGALLLWIAAFFRDVKTWQMRRPYDYLLLVLSLCVGGYAVVSLRQPWADKPSGGWLWWLLIAAGLLGGFALTRTDRWLSDAQPLARPVSGGSSRFRRVIGLCCLLASAGLTAWLIWRLWPDYHNNWNSALWPWLVALALTLLGGGLIGTLKSTSARQGQPTLAQPVTTLENRPTLDSEGQPATISEGQPAPTTHETEEGRLDDKIPLGLKAIIFILITGLAVFLRTYRIDIIPAGIWADETNCGGCS